MRNVEAQCVCSSSRALSGGCKGAGWQLMSLKHALLRRYAGASVADADIAA
jgi:hypothetical protein